MYSSVTPKTLESSFEADTHQNGLIQETKRLGKERKSIHSEIKSILHEITLLDTRTRRLRQERHHGLYDPLYLKCREFLGKLENVTELFEIPVEIKEINKIIELMPLLDENKHSKIIMLQDQLVQCIENNILSRYELNDLKLILRQLSEFGFQEREAINDGLIHKFLMLIIDFPEYQTEIFENNAKWGREVLELDGMRFLIYKILFVQENATKLYDLVDNHTAKMQILYERMVILLDAESVLEKQKNQTKDTLPPVLLDIVLDYLGSVKDICEIFVSTLLYQEIEAGKTLYSYLMNYKNTEEQKKVSIELLQDKILYSIQEKKPSDAQKIIASYKNYNPSFLENIFSKPTFYTINLMKHLKIIITDECKSLLMKYQDNWVNSIFLDDQFQSKKFIHDYSYSCSIEKISFLLNFKIKELDDIFMKVSQKSYPTQTELKLIMHHDMSPYAKNQLLSIFRKSVPIFDETLKAKEYFLDKINSANAEYKGGLTEEQFNSSIKDLDISIILQRFLQHRNLLAYKHEKNFFTNPLVRLYDSVILSFQKLYPNYFKDFTQNEMQQNIIKLKTHRGQLVLPSIKMKEVQSKRYF
jgi:hypothetical protein